MKNLHLFLAIILSFQLFALDSSAVKGLVQSADSDAIAFAAVIVHSAQNSSIVKVGIGQVDGVFSISNLTPGTYFIEVKVPGYTAFTTDVFTVHDYKEFVLPAIILKSKAGMESETGHPPKIKSTGVTPNPILS
jgi:hypothetical protein